MSNEINKITALADDGDVPSMCEIASRYFEGRGVSKNPELAFSYFQKAAKHGSGWANHMCGALSETGAGVKKSYTKARDFYSKAAETGNASSAFNLGVLYETGTGLKKNTEKAKYYYEKASANGHAGAAKNRAGLAQRERPNPDIVTALTYLGKAYALGEKDAGVEILRLVQNLGILPALKDQL